jgi:hypothetical protein
MLAPTICFQLTFAITRNRVGNLSIPYIAE